MSTEYFKDGNYIYECKTSPSKQEMDISRLNLAIKKLRKLWDRGQKPRGYRYVFPINTLNAKSIQTLESLRSDYPDIDIRWYDEKQVERLIVSLKKVGSLPELQSYVENAQLNSLKS